MLAVLAVFAAGCAKTYYRNGRDNVGLANKESIKVYPLRAEMEVGEKISGVAECETWLGIFKKKPAAQTYGMVLYPADGNSAPDVCTKAAFYDALSKNHADTIIAPQYTSVQKKELCIFGIKSLCLHVTDQIIVKGFKGTVKNIKPVEKELADFKWKADALKRTNNGILLSISDIQ